MPKLRLRSCFWMRMRPNGDILATKEAVMRDNAADEIQRRAVEWHIRLRDGDDDLWDSFSLWLTEDVRHVEAYETVERIDNALEPFLPDLVFREAANDADADVPARSWAKTLGGGGALAA